MDPQDYMQWFYDCTEPDEKRKALVQMAENCAMDPETHQNFRLLVDATKRGQLDATHYYAVSQGLITLMEAGWAPAEELLVDLLNNLPPAPTPPATGQDILLAVVGALKTAGMANPGLNGAIPRLAKTIDDRNKRLGNDAKERAQFIKDRLDDLRRSL